MIFSLCRYLTILAAFLLIAPTISIGAETVPMPKAYNSLSTGLLALGASGTEMAKMERSIKRLEAFRLVFTRSLLASVNGQIGVAADETSEVALLCSIRASHVATVARFGYINSVATQIQELSKPTNPTDLGSALKALFASYAIDASAASLAPATLTKVEGEVADRCKKDIAGFDKSYYGVSLRPPGLATAADAPVDLPFSTSVFGPIGTLIDTIIGIITPIAIEAATLVDEIKREKAVRDFLSVPANQVALRSAGAQLAAAISKYTWEKRLKLAGSFVEQLATVRVTKIDLSKVEKCKNLNVSPLLATRAASGAPNHDLMVCIRAAWEPLSKPLSELIKTAEEYDALADAGNSDTAKAAFDAISQDLTAVSENAITNPKALWQYVTQLVGFANTLQNSFSQDNREKVRKAIDSAVAAF